MPDIDWQETKGIIAEVQELFTGNEDIDFAEEIKALQREMNNKVKQREENTQEAIRALTAEVATEQSIVDLIPASQEAAQKAQLDLEKNLSSVQEAVQKLKEDINQCGNIKEDLQTKLQEVEQSQKACEEALASQAPRVLHALSLYANITGIRWRYDDEEQQHLIRGWVALMPEHEVREFCFDCTKDTTFKIANSLWDLIETPAQ